MKKLTTPELAELAAHAQAAGRGADVFDYWCELGELIAGFAIQARGFHFQIAADETEAWLMTLLAESSTYALCKACDLARPLAPQRSTQEPSTRSARATLPKLSDLGAEDDPAARAARMLAQAALTSPDMPSAWAAHVTTELIESLVAIASEFEASWSAQAASDAMAREHPLWSRTPDLRSRRAAYVYVRDRKPVMAESGSGRAVVGLRGQPAPPSPGEAERALEQCFVLAQGRLSHGPRVLSAHARYKRGSLFELG